MRFHFSFAFEKKSEKKQQAQAGAFDIPAEGGGPLHAPFPVAFFLLC